ncbi:hypothetical protein [Paenibacillus protaetiae]|uniref:IDEAL domain-containing protein n=1 Tax=Paenibacillus protaetiae TaxID=2509456 RepID=A0A4P6EWU7_9BACL|nr:hypothetical protein [Paenibacillus protaetiae]QAY66683.1 hypothetical protein ET464_09965 [Paenibacillus protaetiae]
MNSYEIGDWVHGRSAEGEWISGFLEASDAGQHIAKVRVVQSDNERAVGKLAAVRYNWIKALPVYEDLNAVQLHSLIDIALAAKDEAWFYELAGRLENTSGQSGERRSTEPAPFILNRLGTYRSQM